MTPYSHEVTHGLLLALGAVAALAVFERGAGAGWSAATGLLAGLSLLTKPEIAAAVRNHAGEAARFYLSIIDVVMPGWYLAGEERQVHFGENFVDYPDQALSIFRAKALIERAGRKELERLLDLPWCPGDLFYIEKLVRILES